MPNTKISFGRQKTREDKQPFCLWCFVKLESHGTDERCPLACSCCIPGGVGLAPASRPQQDTVCCRRLSQVVKQIQLKMCQ